MRRDRSTLVRFAMLANSSPRTVSAWDQATRPAIRDRRFGAILRAAAFAVWVGLLFGALACGFWTGVSWLADLGASDRGIMDSTY